MAYTTIKKPSDYFNGKTYLGSASAVTVTGLDFQPDLVWVKDRDNGNNHCLVDAVRGAGKYISSDLTSAETDNATNSISAFNSDGFTTGTANPANEAASTTKGFMSWNWKANGAGVANTDGSISSTVSVNTTSGFSIVKYNGNSTAGATIGHGLGVAPSMIIIKAYSSQASGDNWIVYHKSMGNTKAVYLNLTSAPDTASGYFNNTSPTSSVFTVGNYDNVNRATGDKAIIAYCFAEKQGYSKFGSYTGNGNADGTFVYTGFKPAFILWKSSTDGTKNWSIFDNKRDTYNVTNHYLLPNLSNAEGTSDSCDLLSNGFKWRSTDGGSNASGATFIYMAFASEPLVGDNPATAR